MARSGSSLAEARSRFGDAIGHLQHAAEELAMLEETEDDILAFDAFSPGHWSKLRFTNPLERFKRETSRRVDVVGIFPNDTSLIRLVSMLAIEANDCHEGQARNRPRVRSSSRRRLGVFIDRFATRGGLHAASRHRLGHAPRELVCA
jgi:transposase-like protein